MTGEKGEIAKDSVLLQIELMFYQNGEKGTKDVKMNSQSLKA
jgi:hypothetical protein